MPPRMMPESGLARSVSAAICYEAAFWPLGAARSGFPHIVGDDEDGISTCDTSDIYGAHVTVENAMPPASGRLATLGSRRGASRCSS